jgi:maltokinase
MNSVGAPDRELLPLLVEYLPRQRWFSAKGQQLDLSAIDITQRTIIEQDYHESDIEQVLFTVRTATGVHRYQMWIGWCWQVPDRIAHAAIGAVEGRTAYDALSDVNVSRLLLEAVDQNRDFGGGLRARREPDAKIDVGAEGLVIGDVKCF